MNPPVSQRSVGEVKKMAKSTRMYFSIEWPHRSRTTIHFPVQLLRRRTIGSGQLGSATAVHKCFHHPNIASTSFFQEFHSRNIMWADSPMHAHLHDAVIGPSSLQHGTTLANRMSGWLLDKDMCTGINCRNGVQRMPMVRSGNNRDLDLFLFQQFAEITIRSRHIARQFLNFLCGQFQLVLIHVAKGNHHYISCSNRFTKNIHAPPPRANQCRFVAFRLVLATVNDGSPSTCSCHSHGLYELSAFDCHHKFLKLDPISSTH